MRKLLFISPILLLFLFYSCHTIYIGEESQKTIKQNLQLGTVGEYKGFLLEQDYNHTAIPKYKNPIKVQINFEYFNKASIKAFNKAKLSQTKKVRINYMDSMVNKPRYIKLEIADRVSVLNALNAKENIALFQFLKTNNTADIVTSVSMALNESDLTAIENADEVFLERAGKKSYALKTYINNEEQKTVLFSHGVVFAYVSSNFCWKQNDKYQLEIIDIVESSDKCTRSTYKSAKKAKKQIDYFKL
ncbi:hypothetical protein HSX10_07325 [Winogradskyella undariae]|uniref:hypothetical protein n=1 Tax=Winogradskyella undariae TaxID=1285465 RepID=UPI00156B8098|nr:hypothetical protein [Winogradskyella undariae]NRR91371.1 hypothetical protein [Winogradskyella undariae]